MLIAPILFGPFAPPLSPALQCEVCRLGVICAACMHPGGVFLACSLCAQNIATAMVIRVAFTQDTERLDERADA